MAKKLSHKANNLYKMTKLDYDGHCAYCGKVLAGELRLIGWDICKQCDVEIMTGQRSTKSV